MNHSTSEQFPKNPVKPRRAGDGEGRRAADLNREAHGEAELSKNRNQAEKTVTVLGRHVLGVFREESGGHVTDPGGGETGRRRPWGGARRQARSPEGLVAEQNCASRSARGRKPSGGRE